MAESVSKLTYILEAAQANAEAAKLSGNLDGVGKAAKSGAAQATAALNTTASASRGATVSSAQLNDMYKNVVRTQGAGSATAKELAAALGIQTTATKASTAATGANTVAAGANATAQTVTEVAATKLTNSVNLSGRAMTQLDKAVGVLVGSFGGVSLGMAAFIGLAASLLPKLIELITAKQELIKLDNEQIEVDVRRNTAMNTGTLFTREYATVLRDITAQNLELKKASQAVSLAQGEEADAVRKSSTVARDYAENTNDLSSKIAAYVVQVFSSVKSESVATAARLDATKALDEQIAARIRTAAAIGQTAEALIAEQVALGASTVLVERLTAALDEGLRAQLRFRAGRGLIGDVRTQVAQEAAAAGVTLTHTEAVKRFNAELVKRGEATVKLGAETALAEKNLSAFNETQARSARGSGAAAAAARSYANTLVDLRARAKDAEAALTLDTLSLQQFRISTQIQKERERLEINKKDKAEALRFLDQIERASLEATLRAAAEANKQAQERARSERLRRQAQIERDEKIHSDKLLKIFLDRQAAINKTEETEAAARLAESRFNEEKGRGVIREGADAELRKVQQVFADLDETAISFEAHLRAIDAFSGDASFLLGLKNALGGVINTFDLAEAAGFSFANALQVAFDRAINFGESFMEVFGKTLIAGILSAIGQAAIAEGTYHILAGIAKLFNPFTAAQGAHEIAAGVALVAFGSALVAGATAITSSLNKQQNAGGSAGAGASGGGAAAPTGNQGVPPNVIPFPTSQQGSGSQAIVFDASQTADMVMRVLEARGVVTVRTVRGQHNRQLKKALT